MALLENHPEHDLLCSTCPLHGVGKKRRSACAQAQIRDLCPLSKCEPVVKYDAEACLRFIGSKLLRSTGGFLKL